MKLLDAHIFSNRRNFKDRDIVVCAIRTSGGTVDFVNKHSTPAPIIYQKELVPIGTSKAQTTKTNKEKAKQMLDDLIQLSTKMGAKK